MVADTSNERSDPVQHYYRCNAPISKKAPRYTALLRYEILSTSFNWETVIRSMPVVMPLPDLRHPMLELYGLYEFIRPFRLLKQLCLTRSRWIFDSYVLAVRVIRSKIVATNSFAF